MRGAYPTAIPLVSDSVMLVRNPSVTHLVDADQRNVVLKVLSR